MSESTAPAPAPDSPFPPVSTRHPAGLWFFFWGEFAERASFYGMRAILPLYLKRLDALEEAIRREKIVTLPDRKAVIRLASEAESAMSPAPNMRPPRLIGNQGEYGEFVLPLVVPGKEGREALRMDDFTHDAGTWSLNQTAPGAARRRNTAQLPYTPKPRSKLTLPGRPMARHKVAIIA